MNDFVLFLRLSASQNSAIRAYFNIKLWGRDSSCSVFSNWKQSWSQLFHLAPWCVARALKLLEMRNSGSIEVQKNRLEILKYSSGFWIQRVTMRWLRAAERRRACQSWQRFFKIFSRQISWHEDKDEGKIRNAKRCKLKAHELLEKIMLDIKLALFH